MDGNAFSLQVDALRSQIIDIRPCLEGEVAPRHEALVESLQLLATMAEDQLAHERTGRATAEALAERTEAMVQGLDAIVWVADAGTGVYSFISRHAEEALGYPIDRWLARPGFWAEYIHDEDRRYAADHRARCLREGRDVEFEYRAVTAAGRVVWFRESIRLVHDQGREPELRGHMWDISRRKKVEKQLYAAKSELTRQLDDLTYLHAMSTRLSPLMELGPLLDEILAVVAALQGAEMGLIRLYDLSAQGLRVVASIGFTEDYLTRVAHLVLGEMACGLAAETRSPVLIEDIEAEPAYAPYLEAARLAGYRGVYSTPLIARGGDVLGTIATHFREPHRSPEHQVRVVELYARQVADFVENAQLRRPSGEA
jgi:PAS domain S-box-containing protein